MNDLSEQRSAVGALIHSSRRRAGLSMAAVAEASGDRISTGYLSQVETGKISKPSPAMLGEIALAIGIPYEELMSAAGHTPPAGVPGSMVRLPQVDATHSEEDEQLTLVLLKASGLIPEDRRRLLEYIEYLDYQRDQA